jgi:hypothetical protein
MLRILFAIVVGAACAAPSGALAFTGQFVRDACMSGDEKMESMCVGYAAGIGQTLILSNRWAGEQMPAKFCPPDDFQPNDTAALMLEYLDEHPDEHSLDAAVVGLSALNGAFPCEAALSPGFFLTPRPVY